MRHATPEVRLPALPSAVNQTEDAVTALEARWESAPGWVVALGSLAPVESSTVPLTEPVVLHGGAIIGRGENLPVSRRVHVPFIPLIAQKGTISGGMIPWPLEASFLRASLAAAERESILRIADGLDRSHGQLVTSVKCRVRAKRFEFEAAARADCEAELTAARRKANLFEMVFGRRAVFRSVSDERREPLHQGNLEMLSAEALWS